MPSGRSMRDGVNSLARRALPARNSAGDAPSVSVGTGLEYLQGLDQATNYRFNWDGGLNSAVGKGFSIATAVSVRYDHNPIPNVEKTDVITSISLVYHLL